MEAFSQFHGPLPADAIIAGATADRFTPFASRWSYFWSQPDIEPPL